MWALVALAAAISPEAVRILEEHECHRCHEVEGLAAPPPERSCAGCHAQIASTAGDPAATEAGRRTYGDAWVRFVRRTGEHYRQVPALRSMGRFRASWLRAFLARPDDVRPHLTETMVRTNLDRRAIEALVAGWGAQPDEPLPLSDEIEIARGRRLFGERGCDACHHFGAAGHRDDAPAHPLAPDLAHARKRLNFRAIVEWIRDPSRAKPGTPMPPTNLAAGEAEAIARYLVFAEPRPAPSAAREPASDVPAPTWANVQREVFRATCWHCHSDPLFNGGDGGPGNTGGFGWAGTGASYANWSDVVGGPSLRRGADGATVLVERLRQRVREVECEQSGWRGRACEQVALAPPGMPLGLPALTPRALALVEAWVNAGRPGPGR